MRKSQDILLILLVSGLLTGCTQLPTGGSSMFPSLSNVFTSGFSLSPDVNIAKNMKGRAISDAIETLGEPSKRTAKGNVMELEWYHYESVPYTSWVTTGTEQKLVGMNPSLNPNSPATPVFQNIDHGYYEDRVKNYECRIIMHMQNSMIIDSSVKGNVCAEFIYALRKNVIADT